MLGRVADPTGSEFEKNPGLDPSLEKKETDTDPTLEKQPGSVSYLNPDKATFPAIGIVHFIICILYDFKRFV